MHSRMVARPVFNRLVRPVLIAAFGLAASAACLAGEVVDRIERTFPAKGKPVIFVRNSDGRTILRATPAAEVHVTAVKEVVDASSGEEARREAGRVEVRIEQIGNRVEIEAKHPRTSGFWNHRPQVLVHFEVTGPVASDIEAHSSDGALEATGFNGELQLSTSDGRLTATDCAGRLSTHVSDGDMRIIGARGELDARTSDGRITIDGVFKALDVKSSDGDLDVTVLPGSVMEKPWSVTSSDGSIRVKLPDGFSADVDISTSDGNIRVDQPITVSGLVKSEHHLAGKLNSGGNLLRIHASDGSVQVTH